MSGRLSTLTSTLFTEARIYFELGALTSNQILKRQGKEAYDEGNQYFVSSTFIPIGEQPVEKRAAILEAIGKIIRGDPGAAKEILKLAKREARK